jgi:hypothetical protein
MYRLLVSIWQRRNPLVGVIGNFSYRNNSRMDNEAYASFKLQRGEAYQTTSAAETCPPCSQPSDLCIPQPPAGRAGGSAKSADRRRTVRFSNTKVMPAPELSRRSVEQ